MSDQRADVIRTIENMVATMNTHDLERCVSYYSDDAELQDPRFPEPVRGRNYVEQGFAYWFAAFPDVRVTITRLIVDPPDVAVEWTFEATHRAEYVGVQPSGRRFHVLTAAHFSVVDGHVTRDFSLFDAIGVRTLEELAASGEGA